MIYERKVNYYETDAMKVVHHSNYIRFLEESRIYYMDKMGLPYSKMEEEGIMIPVLSVNCEYKHPASFDEILEIEVHIKEYSGVKLIMEYVITNKNTGLICLTGETKHCFTDKNMKPISLKKVKPYMHEKFLEEIKKIGEINL